MKKDEKRTTVRHPYKSAAIYTALGYPVYPPDRAEADAEILDLSDSGMRMLIEGRTLEAGNVLRVRIPVSNIQAAVPTLAQVMWTKKENAKVYQVGLKFVVQ